MEGKAWLERSSEDGTGRIVAVLDVELQVKEPSSRSGRCEGDGGSSGGTSESRARRPGPQAEPEQQRQTGG